VILVRIHGIICKIPDCKKAFLITTPTNQLNKRRQTQKSPGLLSRVSQALAHPPLFLATVFLVALAIRLILVAVLVHNVPTVTIDHNDFGWESWEVGWTARSIFLGQGFSSPFLPITGPTALVPPLYTYLVAGAFKLFGLDTVHSAFAILSFNSLCSALTCIPLYFLMQNSLSTKAGRFSSIAWAIYPFAIYFSADRVWDYALTALLFTCSLLLAQRLHVKGWKAWLAFGALYGVAVLSNPSVVTLLPFLLLIAMYKVWRIGGNWFTKSLIASLAFLAVCAPWTIRNDRAMHSHFFLRDGFWLEFYAGNNGDTSESNSSWAHPGSNPLEMKKYQEMGEVAYMAQKHDLAVDFVKHHPGFFVVATLRRIVRFWTGYWSFGRAYLKLEPFDVPNVPFCLFLTFFLIRGLTRWWREDKGSALPSLLAVLIFPIPYYLTHSSMDYRQPLEPVIITMVVVGLFGTGNKQINIESLEANERESEKSEEREELVLA